ncbi:P-loop containing nucleoside triphosphate hydrolase protein [Westerdykella ornata]|uniref:Structural maintenance of chromosomes protein 5 n=1 Tax=Westerdykella ornata TaxID=318751 RepID=A0A6A6JB47_WESOR|nr:P-loop containing nucleoside triphosphate hydrolase protein [Westerdykella ornata]KAF2272846.1 P-loop containing nucleoside triphosphate hydrolase protein [Westerdykella ornata]
MPGLKRDSADISENDEPSYTSSRASSGSKRTRYDRDASTLSEPRPVANGNRNPATAQDGEEYTQEPHQPGTIVRVTLINFVTYTAAEFHPGPSLNMVIGPNGTGKSTLVCAICLGLGWDPRNLGRAKEIGEFVKHGSTEATIEIELAGAEHHDTNPVIRRIIRKEGNKSVWFIHGRQSTQKEVVRLAKSFAIQIDNLCQFLPQDRVVEFAGLSPVALLKETLRAAAPEEMVQWHDELINLRSEEKKLESEQKGEEAALKQLQNRQNASREDVERYHERQALVTKQRALHRCRPLIERNLLGNQIQDIKAQLQETQQQQRQVEAAAGPARAAEHEMESYRDEVSKCKNERRTHTDEMQKRADGIAARIKAEQDRMAECTNKVEGEKQGEKQRRQELKRLEATIQKIERDMQEAPVEVDEVGYRERRTELQNRKMDVAGKKREVASRRQDIVAQVTMLRNRMQEKVNEQALLNTQSGQQANLLQRVSKDTATGWDWIQKHKHELQLKGEIHGPPILTCSVTDQRYADIVEGQFGGIGDATAITFTNGEDQRLISNKLLGRDGLGLHQITLRMVGQPLAHYRSPVTREELRDLGFEGFVLDYIQGPEPVLAMLCESAQLHRAAYSPNPLSIEQHEAVERSPIATWTAGRERYRVTRRREYGISSTRVTALPRAKYFTDQPSDPNQTRQLEEEISNLKGDIESLKEENNNANVEADKYSNEEADIKKEIEALDENHRRQQKARAQWAALPEKKAEKESELDALKSLMRETSNRILAIKTRSEKAALKAASLTIEYQKAVAALRQAHESLVEAEIRLIEANSELDSVKRENREINETLAALESKYNELDRQKRDLSARYKDITRNAKRLFPTLSEEEREYLRDYSQLASMEELNTEIEAVNTRLGLMAEGNSHVVEAFENREREIAHKGEVLQKLAERLEKTRANIRTIREQWEPRLDELVATISDGFSHNFAQIGCAGQVGVHKDEDFEHWSIQIQVRFRENEALSILDSHRQSGGERAVSTIFYLMALQDLARSPFRVVDEINQGMDPRNERMVHERMVDIACRERTSQYFLITPKLLSDLKFHPKMKMHCIASGEHMPARMRGRDCGEWGEMAVRKKMGVA